MLSDIFSIIELFNKKNLVILTLIKEDEVTKALKATYVNTPCWLLEFAMTDQEKRRLQPHIGSYNTLKKNFDFFVEIEHLY